MKPELSCCEPIRIPFPSGLAWAHSSSCKVNPRQKVRVGEDHPSRWRGARHGWWAPAPFIGLKGEATAWRLHHGRPSA